MKSFLFCLTLWCLAIWPMRAPAGSWPQFRGPNASGWADSADKLPAEIGPERNVVWKTALPPGHSSPVVAGDRVYLTGVQGQTLLTVALERRSGKILWQKEAPHNELEKIHPIGSYAQATPATDGERVVSFFGSSGLFCYDPSGKLLWRRPLGPFKNDFGSGSSPIIVGDRVILNLDHDTDSCLLALDKRTGETLWKADRSEFPRGYATPVIWEVDSRKQIVVNGTLRVVGYETETGKEIWTVRGLARIVNMTPSIGPGNVLYLPAWSPGGDDDDRIELPSFADMIRKHDKNKNGTLEHNEVPPGALRDRFTQIDRDKDGHITEKEYETMRQIFDGAHNLFLAIKPGGRGDITQTHVLWRQKKNLPYVPSPLYANGCLFMVKNGGVLTCLDAKTGSVMKQERAFGTTSYYSSPVGGDGKIYLLGEKGDLTVVRAGPGCEVLSKARFGEDAFATPAIVDGKIYLRTNGHLYCFAVGKAD